MCGVPMTDEANVRLFEGLEKEKNVASKGQAAAARLKAKKALPGDLNLMRNWEHQKMEEAKVKLACARERQTNGVATKADLTLLKSKLVKKIEALQTGPVPPTPTPSGTTPRTTAPKKKRKRKRQEDSESDSSNGDSSSDDEDDDKGKDLLQKLFEDEGQLFKVTGFGVGDADERALFYVLDGEDAEEECSTVAEVRNWVQACEATN